MLKSYFATWWQVMARPIFFYTKLREESWREASLTFLLITAWLLALFLAVAVFLMQYIQIGATLIAGITGYKLLLILPVVVTLAGAFFVMTLLILAGMTVVGLGVAGWVVAFVLHYIYMALGGKGKLNRMVQQVYYSAAAALVLALPVLLAVLTKFGWLDFALFRAGFLFIAVCLAVYVYGLWAIAGRKVYGLPKWKAFVGAAVPVIGLLIFILLFDKIGLKKLESWITPLK